MSAWQRVAPMAEFPVGSRKVVDVEGVQAAVFHLSDGLYAIEDVCTHDGGDLASGVLEGYEIVCPRHGARFDLRTGEVTAPPAYASVAVLPVRVEAGWVEVRDDRWD